MSARAPRDGGPVGTLARVGDAAEPPVERVLYVAKTHLDVGFTDLAATVRKRYLDDFFPRAVATAAELRAAGGPARFRWTTGSWILTEALQTVDRQRRATIERAIEQGDLCWHAMPFTLHTEFADRSLVEHGLSLSAELDRRFGRRTLAAKMTDVPGHTRSLVPLLADAGVELLHIGVNPAAATPAVPDQFVWRAGSAEISVMYQPGGYGDVQVIRGTGVAVAVDVTGDNLGPRSAAEVTAAFDSLAARFPGAEVVAGTLDDVALAVRSARATLPVVTAELGDTWIHGVGSDPVKVAGFRALARQRAGWIRDGEVSADDPGLRAASTRLLLVAEHTWGLDQKSHWPDTTHWSASELAEVRDDEATRRFEASWQEQRSLLDEYVELLRASCHCSLADDAAAELASSRESPRRLSTEALEPVAVDQVVELGGRSLRVDSDGSVLDGSVLDGAGVLCAVGQQTFDADDFERWYSTYNASVTPDNEWWARWDNTKPGLEHSGARSAWWGTRLVGAWVGEDERGPLLVVEQRIDAAPDDPVAVPSSYRTTLRSAAAGTGLELELAWWDRPAARWPGALWWRLSPRVTDPVGWRMVKLGAEVSPFDVVAGGARRLHVADRLVHSDGTTIDLMDTGLVAPGPPRLLVWDDEQAALPDGWLSDGWHVCVHANLWGTNFPMWVEGDGRCRTSVRFS